MRPYLILTSAWWLSAFLWRCWHASSSTSGAMNYLERVTNFLFHEPSPPSIDLGWAGKLTGAESTIKMAFSAAYWTGVKDGLIVGVVITLAGIVALVVLRFNPVSGVKDVLKSL